MTILRPARLKPGDTIGLVSPSKSARLIPDSVWRCGVDRLNAKGFNVVEGRATRGDQGHAGASVIDRVRDLEEMFARDDVHAIMAICGGSNANQLLDGLDYALIAHHPKIFIGFSDTTALTSAIQQQTGLVTFSGPSFLSFCQPDLSAYTEHLFDDLLILAHQQIQIEPATEWADEWRRPYPTNRPWHPSPGWQIIRPGTAHGMALGGNLETLLLLAGTHYWPDLNDAILFLECCRDERPATVHRYLTQLRQMGVFGQIKGLVIGRFPSEAGFTEDDSLAMILEDVARGTDFPIITDVDFGHTDPLMTIPLGIPCELTTQPAQITFTEHAVL